MSEEEEDCCTCPSKWCFYILSFISCQYVPDASTIQGNRKKTACSISFIFYLVLASVIIGGIIVLNCFPLVLFVMDWGWCPIQYYNICYTLEFHSSNRTSAKVPEILLRSDDDSKKC